MIGCSWCMHHSIDLSPVRHPTSCRHCCVLPCPPCLPGAMSRADRDDGHQHQQAATLQDSLRRIRSSQRGARRRLSSTEALHRSQAADRERSRWSTDRLGALGVPTSRDPPAKTAGILSSPASVLSRCSLRSPRRSKDATQEANANANTNANANANTNANTNANANTDTNTNTNTNTNANRESNQASGATICCRTRQNSRGGPQTTCSPRSHRPSDGSAARESHQRYGRGVFHEFGIHGPVRQLARFGALPQD